MASRVKCQKAETVHEWGLYLEGLWPRLLVPRGVERAQVLKLPFWPPRPRADSLCVAFQRSPVPSFSLGTLAPLAEQPDLPYPASEKPLVTEQDLPDANPVRSALGSPTC